MAKRSNVLTENTRITLSIATFAILIIWIVTNVAFITQWKADVENVQKNHETRFEDVEKDIEVMVKDLEAIQEVEVSLAEIKRDLKWITLQMGKGSEN